MKVILSVFTLLFSVLITAQTQNVRGKVLDSETSFPLAGAKIEIDLKVNNNLKLSFNYVKYGKKKDIRNSLEDRQ